MSGIQQYLKWPYNGIIINPTTPDRPPIIGIIDGIDLLLRPFSAAFISTKKHHQLKREMVMANTNITSEIIQFTICIVYLRFMIRIFVGQAFL